MKNRLAIGLMSGSSLDGIDASLVRVTKKNDVKILASVHTAYPKRFAPAIRDLASRNLLGDAARFGTVWSELAARSVAKLLNYAKVSSKQIAVIGAHGQTVLHQPNPRKYLGHKVGVTVQLADLSRLAIRTGITVVGDFRSADIAVGGQGAPFAPYAHKILFAEKKDAMAVQNMGGIGNVTLLKRSKVISAFDTGPGNVWIDTVVRWKTKGRASFDRNGALGRKGKVNRSLVRRLLRHSYFRKQPPKSAGWEQFSEEKMKPFRSAFVSLSKEDAVATATFATAQATVGAYRKFVFPAAEPSEIVVVGGGAKNRFLLDLLRAGLAPCEIVSSKEYEIDPQEVEAISFALLGLATLDRKPNNEPAATGARRAVIGGVIAFAGK